MKTVTRNSGKIRHVEFHRTKYGRELLVDVVRAQEIPFLDLGGDPHVLAFYEIFLVTKGRGRIALDGKAYALSPGDLFFTRPGQPRQWSTDGLDGLCLFFTSDFVEEFFRDPLFLFTLPYFHHDGADLRLHLGPKQTSLMSARLQAMKREVEGLRSDSPHALRAALYQTLIELARLYTERTGETVRENPTAVRLRLLIERHFRDVHQPQGYARRLRITVGHLNQLARRHLGRSAGIVIRERIALEAKRQLAHTDTSAAEIGYALGFRDPAYFARFFKREVGVSPSAFRA
ncbi:MAG: helix-turn-helix domain-containing protein [Vicinamibacteria bacterium]